MAVAAEQRPDGLPDSVAFVPVKNARRALALAAAKFYPRQPATIAAVTGTSGKTSVAAFTRQIWAALGLQAASIGTVGVVSPKSETYGSLTTPDPVELHRRSMRWRARASRIWRWKRPRTASTSTGSTACASPPAASPIYRAIISTITRAWKPISPPSCACSPNWCAPGGTAVIDVDDCYAGQVIDAAKAHGLKIMTVGVKGDDIKLVDGKIDGFAQVVTLAHGGHDYKIKLPLVGAFQVQNAAVAAGLAIATGAEPARVFAALEKLDRRQRPARACRRATTARRSLSTTRTSPTRWTKRLKRCALMRAANWSSCSAPAATATRANVRSWAASRRECRPRHRHRRQSAQRAAGRDPRRDPWPQRPAPSKSATAPRRFATAIAELKAGDVLLIAGKGHETGQIVGDKILPFLRSRRGRRRLEGQRGMTALWTIDDMAKAMRRRKIRRAAGRGHRPLHRQPQPCARRCLLRHSRRQPRRSRLRRRRAQGRRGSRGGRARQAPAIFRRRRRC